MLQRRPTDFAHRNLLLQVLLGLLSARRRLDPLLERHVPDEPDPDAVPDEVTYALLGVIAFRDRLDGLLKEHGLEDPGPEARPPEEPEPSSPSPRDLLR